MHKLSWNDLQYIVAVANHGSVTAAARALGVYHSTVLRRINSFEESQAVRLFERQRAGYTLTQEGQQLLEVARKVEDVVSVLERKIAGKDLTLEGVIRLTTTDSLLHSVVGPHIAAFQARYPDIVIEVSVTNHLLNLTRRDADVAIRPSQDKPEPLVGQKVSDLNFALYTSRPYWAQNASKSMAEHAWLGLDDLLASTPPGRWLKANAPGAATKFTADSFLAIRDATEHGLGVALLPCFLGDVSELLIRIEGPIATCRNSLWVLTHKDLLGSARVRTFTEFFADALKGDSEKFLGRPKAADSTKADAAPVY